MRYVILLGVCVGFWPLIVAAETQPARSPAPIVWKSPGSAEASTRIESVKVHRGPAVAPEPSLPVADVASALVASSGRASYPRSKATYRDVYEVVRLRNHYHRRPRLSGYLQVRIGDGVIVTVQGGRPRAHAHGHPYAHPHYYRPARPERRYRYPHRGRN